MDIGDAVLVKGRIVDFDSNPHGSSVKVELDLEDSEHKNALAEITTFWVHRLESSAILRVEKPESA